MKLNFQKKQQGLTLIEVLLVLGVLILLLLAAFVTFPQVRDRNYVNQENQRLLRIAATLKNLYVTKATYTGLTTDIANQARAFVSEANGGNYGAGQEILNLWGGRVEVAPYAPNPAFMQISYAGVPTDACQKLASGVAVNFAEVSIEGEVVWRKADRLDVDVTKIVQTCSDHPLGATMVFVTE